MFKPSLLKILNDDAYIRAAIGDRPVSPILPLDREHRKLLLGRNDKLELTIAVNSEQVQQHEQSTHNFIEVLSIVILHDRADLKSHDVVGYLLRKFLPEQEDSMLQYTDEANMQVYDFYSVSAVMDQWNPIFDCGMHIVTLEVIFRYDNLHA